MRGMKHLKCTLAVVTTMIAAITIAGDTGAQSYPIRPITMVVPFPAGGPTDTVGRIVADRMQAFVGKPIIIENVPGAAGSIGAGRVARAPGDGLHDQSRNIQHTRAERRHFRSQI